jgi:RimJ/RimL family protein N-acetyltransferase
MTTFRQMQLHTHRLLLRPLVETDALELYGIFSDAQVMRYWSCEPWKSIDQAHDTIAKDLKAHTANEYLRLGLVRLEDAKLIGTCSLFQINEQCRRAEIGFALASSVWHHGYAQEAIRRCLDFAFDDLKLNRLEADVDPRNLASAQCLERLGFIKEGHLRQRWVVAGEVSDSALYGLLAVERPHNDTQNSL